MEEPAKPFEAIGARGTVPDRDELLAAVYEELRRSARRLLRRESSRITVQPTELVNDVVLRVMRLDKMNWNDRQHMFATCSRILRQAMIDAIRTRSRAKRQAPTVTVQSAYDGTEIDIIQLDIALQQLEEIAPELEQIVEMRFFVGLTIEEIAVVLGQSESTVKRRWKAARLWLADILSSDGAGPA